MSWEKEVLSNISIVDWGNTNLTKESFSQDGTYLGVSAAGVDGRIKHYEHDYGTLVVSAIGANCGKLFFPEDRFTAIKNTITITPKANKVNSKYLYYYLTINSFRRRGAGQPFISKGDTELIEIPLPPLPIQQKIAAILDQADALRKKDQQQLAKYDELLQAVFYDLFGDPVKNEKGWERKKMEELSDYVTKGESPNWQGYSYIDNGVRFVTSENVLWGELDLGEEKSKFIPDKFHDKLKRSQLEEGNILINLVGASIGRCAIVNKECIPGNINQAVASVKLKNDKIDNSYCLYLLINKSFQEVLRGNIVEAARANISLTDIRELKIPLPDISKQRHFKRIAQNIQQQKEQVKQQLQQSEALFQSLLQGAFKGELVKE